MIASMTGYGSAQAQMGTRSFIVELRTVNNRYFKARLKLPEPAAFMEDQIESCLRKSLCRGMVNYTLHLKDMDPTGLCSINDELLKKYIKMLGEIAKNSDIKTSIDISNLLTLPEVLTSANPDEKDIEIIKTAVMDLTAEAIKSLQQMRDAEGQALADDLAGHCDNIILKLDLIKGRIDVVMADYITRLQKKTQDLLKGTNVEVDQQSLAREIAIFAEKSDISEEIARLTSHIQQFEDCCKADNDGKHAGRRLDFLAQEMLREANTIASKAADAQIIHNVVDIKCMIDRIKEQVQNVE